MMVMRNEDMDNEDDDDHDEDDDEDFATLRYVSLTRSLVAID